MTCIASAAFLGTGILEFVCVSVCLLLFLFDGEGMMLCTKALGWGGILFISHQVGHDLSFLLPFFWSRDRITARVFIFIFLFLDTLLDSSLFPLGPALGGLILCALALGGYLSIHKTKAWTGNEWSAACFHDAGEGGGVLNGMRMDSKNGGERVRVDNRSRLRLTTFLRVYPSAGTESTRRGALGNGREVSKRRGYDGWMAASALLCV
jgi:hypothetical protein